VAWAFLANSLPIYPLYVLLFAHAGLSGARISVLFILWSAVGFVAEVPAGALADRWSRRGALVLSGVLQAAGFALWVLMPTFTGFASGFVVWALGGALVSGSIEALLYEGLASAGATEHFPSIYGMVTGADLLSQLPAAASATVLFSVGGFALVTWVSAGVCLAAAGLASCLPEAPVGSVGEAGEGDARGYVRTLRAGVVEALGNPAVRAAIVCVSAVTALDALDEYYPLLARAWGVPTVAVPLSVLAIPLAGALGAAVAGWGDRLRAGIVAGLLGGAFALLWGAALVRRPAGLAAVAVFSCLYRLVLVVVQARLQDRIEGHSRATVTSVAALGTEVGSVLLFALWALEGLTAVVVLGLAVAATLPWLLRPRRT
jgi:hypothetical protein